MLDNYKEFHGLTLEEVARKTGPHLHGYAVFLLPDERSDDVLGDPVAESVSVAAFLKSHPEASGWVVKYTNDYLGMIVLRAVKPTDGKTMENEKRLIAEALKKYHDIQFTTGVYEHSIFGKAAMLLEIDDAEVVRCKDCGHWDVAHGIEGQGWCPKVVGYRHGFWYCASGERKGKRAQE